MKRSVKVSLVTLGTLVLLFVVGNALFVAWDDRVAAGIKFAVFEPEQALKEITMRAEASKSLVGSGSGIVIPGKPSGPIGATKWTVSPNGIVQGTAPESSLMVVWTPILKNEKVEWRCIAEPKRLCVE